MSLIWRVNILVFKQMKLVPNVGSDRSWVWSTPADMSEGEARPEQLAIRFATPENANAFKEKFEEAQQINSTFSPNEENKPPGEDTTAQTTTTPPKTEQASSTEK